MICDVLKFFSQNVRKNKLIINTILKTQFLYDIIFLQEPLWSIICFIPSSNSHKGELLVGIPYHPNWLTFTKSPTNQPNSLRVITYINICVSCLQFFLWNDVLNYRDISCISFSNQSSIYFIINVCFNSSQLALKYLKDTESNIHKVIIMMGDFNIRDSIWDSNFPFHSSHSNSLFGIVDSFSLDISKSLKNVPTRFSNNDHNANSVLDLVFLHSSSPEFNHHCIYPNWRLLSDHTLITVKVSICKERISHTWRSLVKGSDEENQFIKNVIQIIKNVNTTIIQNTETLEEVVQSILSNIEESWQKNSKLIKITRHSKAW